MVRVGTIAVWLVFSTSAFAEVGRGETLYKAQCARCHGADGEGVKKKYDRALVGELAVAQLADVVRKTMPEDAPESLSPADATAIASFVHERFYSPIARERTKPARVDLTRLTVNQYRQAVADLIGPARSGVWVDGGKGLRGQYFADRNYGKRQLERVDAVVRFDFRDRPPIPDGKIGNLEFSIRWSGSVFAPTSGDYTLIARSDHAVALWVNGDRDPILDARVQSGKDTEHKTTVFLTGGRVYNLRFEFCKALQGVPEKNPKPRPASVSLEWKAPGGNLEPIPQRYLSPVGVPEQYIVSTPFPPDDNSLGWERGSAVSKEWDAATTESALEASGAVSRNFQRFAGIDPKMAADKQAIEARKFATRFVELAFRRPLTDEQKALYIERQFAAAKNEPEAAIRRVVLLTLKSPRFLFREIGTNTDRWDTAARLSFALWDSLPDAELVAAAASGKLDSPDEVRKQAQRMLADPRARSKIRGFLMHWLRLDRERDLGKNATLYPGFDADVTADLRTSLELFLDEVVRSDESDFRKLLTSDELWLNGRLSKMYGGKLPLDAPFQKVRIDDGKRAGVLTHPFLMTTFAYSDHSSPIHRGVFLAKGILGTGLKPPQEAFSPLAADAHPGLSTRERVTLQTKGANCQTCHTVINPLGFTLESFDAIGRYRDTDNSKPVDTAGGYLTRTGEAKIFKGATELATFLSGSPEVHEAFAVQLFHHLAQQPIRAYGGQRDRELRDGFAKNGYSIQKLAVEIAVIAARTGRPTQRASLPSP